MPKPGRNISRRDALKLGAFGAAAPASLAVSRPVHSQSISQPTAVPRNIIFMVSDGMSPGVPALAEAFSHIIRSDGKGTNWRDLSARQDVTRGFFDMMSLNSIVTDSAAASTSWGSGTRIFNWALNMLPDGRVLTPLAPLCRDRGKRVGLVTTTRVSHATPAGFAAAAPDRELELEIAPQFVDRVDVLLGGGRKHFSPVLRADRRDVLSEYTRAGWTLIDDRDALLKQPAATDRLLGIFADDHMPFTIDRARDAEIAKRVPTLAEMTRTAIENLSRSEDGFLLQVEGGRVDHAAHDNDAAGMLHDQLAFDDAIGVALEFAKAGGRDDTLIVITTDHGTGNPGLSGMGSKYHRSNAGFEKLAASTASFETINSRLTAKARSAGAAPDPPTLAQLIKDGTGIEITSREARTIADAFAGRATPMPLETCVFQANLAGLLGQALSNHSGVTFTGIVHTSDWALSLALGPGAHRFNGLLANTDAFEIIAEFFRIEHRNPRMTADEAKKFTVARRGTIDAYAL